jgi:hypothetical protein
MRKAVRAETKAWTVCPSTAASLLSSHRRQIDENVCEAQKKVEQRRMQFARERKQDSIRVARLFLLQQYQNTKKYTK